MEITEQICDSRPTPPELHAFEQALGSPLPAAYRGFLLVHNGGRPRESVFTLHPSRAPEEKSSIHYFFGLHAGRIGSLERKRALYQGRLPESFLPVATDAFGNLILLGIGGQHHGKIYFWDHEREDDPPSTENVAQVADSFEEFIAGLAESAPTA